MWPGCGLLTDVPTSGVGHRLLHFPIHRKNAISFLSAADSLLALFSLERFNSLLSYSWHQLRDLMAPFSVWVHSLPLWHNGQSQRNSTRPSHVTVTNENGVYHADYLQGFQFSETYTFLFYSLHFAHPQHHTEMLCWVQSSVWLSADKAQGEKGKNDLTWALSSPKPFSLGHVGTCLIVYTWSVSPRGPGFISQLYSLCSHGRNRQKKLCACGEGRGHSACIIWISLSVSREFTIDCILLRF